MSRSTVSPALIYRNLSRLGEKWKILGQLDEGGFGRVYRVRLTIYRTPLATVILDLQVKNVTKDGPPMAAMKAESVNMDGGSALKLEVPISTVIYRHPSCPFLP